MTKRFLALAFLWGSSFTFIKVALDGVTPSQLVLFRLILGAAVLLAIARWRGIALPGDRVVWGHIVAAAAFGNVIPFLLLSYGEQGTGAGIAGVLVGSTPLLTLALATVALPSERVTLRKTAGMIGGFAGVVLIVGPWATGGGSIGGRIACFLGALSYAVGFVYVRKFLSPRGRAPMSLAAGQMVAATALQVVVTPFLAWHTPHITAAIAGSIAFLGIMSTGFAYVLYFRLIAEAGATTASAVNYVVPLFAVLISVIVLGESVTWNLVAGGAVVLVSMAYAERRWPRRPLAPTRHPVDAAVRSIADRRIECT